MFLVVILYGLFASVFTIGKFGLYYTQPFFLIGSRMLVAGILMLSYLYATGSQKGFLSKGGVWRVFQLAFFGIYLANTCEFWGLQYLTSSKTCFIYSLSPFLSALLSYLVFSETLTWKKGMGLIIGFLGFGPILLYQNSTEGASGQFWVFSFAEIAVVGACFFSVYGWMLLGRLVKENGLTPLFANGLSMVLGGGMALIHSYYTENWDPFPVTSWPSFIECALLLMVVSNLICYNLYGHLLRRFSLTFLSFAGFMTPFFAAFFGWIFLGEIVATPFYLSAAVVFSGLFLFYQDELVAIQSYP